MRPSLVRRAAGIGVSAHPRWVALREAPQVGRFLQEANLTTNRAPGIIVLAGTCRRRRSRIERSEGAPPRACILRLLELAILFAILLVAMPARGDASTGTVDPAVAPLIGACSFQPDPRLATTFSCGVENPIVPAFVNATIRFNMSVSDADPAEDMDVIFYFDRLNPNPLGGPPIVNPDSPVRTIRVPSPGAGQIASVETYWTYDRPPTNFSRRYFVAVEVRGVNGEFDGADVCSSTNPVYGTCTFAVTVDVNTEPYVNNFQSIYGASIEFPDPVVPLIYVNVTVGDNELDGVTATWEWGDGTTTVNQTEALLGDVDLRLVHQYDPSLLPLNETPRIVRFPITLWLDDGIANHNRSQSSVAEFDLDWDRPPRVTIDAPTVEEPPFWKVGEAVTMRGSATDPEGDPIDPDRDVYWDFDDLADSDGDGDPETDRDAPGFEASHPYPAAGNYTISLWATDGETKKLCIGEDCTSTHWTRTRVPITVRNNLAPLIALVEHAGLADETLLLRAFVHDADGDSLLVTWDFDDGSANATNATVGQRGITTGFEVFQEHVYAKASVCDTNRSRACPYNLTITVSDGTDTTVATSPVFIESFNLPPVVFGVTVFRTNGTVATDSTFLFNSTAVVRLNFTEPEVDPVNITVEWGDGSVNITRVTGPTDPACSADALGNTICEFSHVYGDIGEDEELRNYTILVFITDDEEYANIDPPNGTSISIGHTIRTEVDIYILHPRPHGVSPWDWWDYGTLAAVLGIPGILIGRVAWRLRKESREE